MDNAYLLNAEMEALSAVVLVPTYNNEKTLGKVIQEIQKYTNHLLVVNDGSTDNTLKILQGFELKGLVSYQTNVGKGWALRQGFKKATELGYSYAITIDSDGQHLPENLEDFIRKMHQVPGALVVGHRNMDQSTVPKKSSFGHKFSNFWFQVETGVALPDTQSGYRAYPIYKLKNLRWYTKKFEFEIEVMVRASWNRIPVIPVPIKVIYQTGEDRVTHFRPFKDFTRISILNTVLFILAIAYHRPMKMVREFSYSKFKQQFVDALTDKGNPPVKKAAAVGFGVFMGIVPIWGYQMLVAVALSHYFKLNKVLVLVAAQVSLPPFIPFILLASFWTGGVLMGSDNFKLSISDFYDMSVLTNNLLQYAVGAVVFAVVAGLGAFLLSLGTIQLYKSK